MSETLTAVKTNFTSGEIAEELYGRGDLSVYENGARVLENVIIKPSGGVSRRSGLKKIAELSGKTRLIPFEFNTEQKYVLCLSNLKCEVYKNDEKIAEFVTPWSENVLFDLSYTQSADTLLVMHKNIEPQRITRSDNEVWSIEAWSFYTDANGLYCCPYYDFAQGKISIGIEATTGNTYVNTNADYFSEAHVGARLRFSNGEAKITGVVSARRAAVTVEKGFSSTAAVSDWEESAFSAARGWPICATFHQDRLVIGGSKSLPNHIWMSHSSDFFNFDYGTGLDDEAIDFELLSDQVNAIRALISARNLIVFTSGAEWVVKGENLTPEDLSVVRQTTVGTYAGKALNPLLVNGAVVFVSQDGKHLQQFLFSEIEDAYQATDLSLLAGTILKEPQDSTFCADENVVYIVLGDGSVSCLTTYRTEQVTAWSRLKTNGKFCSVTDLGSQIYFCVERDNKYFLEKFSDEAYMDCFEKFTSEGEVSVWDVFENRDDEELSIVGDGSYLGKYTVKNGMIVLPEKVSEIYAGMPYAHKIEPLPFVNPYQVPQSPSSLRVVSGVFRILNSIGFCINMGKGYYEVPMKRFSEYLVFDENPKPYTGDIELRALGWIRNINRAMWSIQSDTPTAFTLLSAALKVKIK